MCGRYKLSTPFRDIVRLYNLTADASRYDNAPARYNIAPTQEVAAVRYDKATQERSLDFLRWGLVPYWAKDAKLGYSLINAACETLADKPAFREAFDRRRCLVLADGFYEWKPLGGKTKQPYLIRMLDRAPFAFAGLWERWTDKATGEVIESCAIITCPPNRVCAPIHNRMPAILAKADYAAWLGEVPATRDELEASLKPCPPALMEAVPISTKVNNVKNEGPELAEEVPEAQEARLL